MAMCLHKKILTFLLTLSCTTFAALCLHAQINLKNTKVKPRHSNPTTIGFQSGRELLFNSSPLVHSKQSKVHYGLSNSLVLRKPLNTHFKAEAGVIYGTVQNSSSMTNLNDRVGNIAAQKACYVSMPLTINYFCLPEHCKVRPYFGAGIQYNINVQGGNAISPFSNETYPQENQTPSGTRYISILFTQGITFQVNTKIEINQSFHFIPDNSNKIFGINLGIGYKIP